MTLNLQRAVLRGFVRSPLPLAAVASPTAAPPHSPSSQSRQRKVLFSLHSPCPKGENYACWNCEHKNTVFCLFCEKCHRPQDPVELKEGRLDYFQVLGLPRKFELSKRMISSSFRALQSKLHPDRYAKASDKERAISSDNSSLVNRAYSVLKNPHTRGMHLLELEKGVSLESESPAAATTAKNPELLMQILELNEEISDPETSVERLREIRRENDRRISEHSEVLAKAFREKNYEEAKRVLEEMKYFVNIGERLAEMDVLAEEESR